MKFISAVGGIAAIRMSADDFGPTTGIPANDIQKRLEQKYNCEPFQPQLQQMIQAAAGRPNPNAPKFWLQNGHLESPDGKIALNHIVMFVNGLWVSSHTSTEHADAAMDDLVAVLDKEFGFKIAANKSPRYHTSNIVVEFDGAVEKISRDLERVAGIINKAIPTPGHTQQFRRLVFGYEGHEENVFTFDTIEWNHFQIERRAQAPYAQNRFFCTAALSTQEHYAVLQDIEKALVG